VALLLLRGLSVPVFANLLGGGTNGASVTLTDNGDGTVTMSGTNLVISGSGGTVPFQKKLQTRQ